jgi:hypothetical protein
VEELTTEMANLHVEYRKQIEVCNLHKINIWDRLLATFEDVIFIFEGLNLGTRHLGNWGFNLNFIQM